MPRKSSNVQIFKGELNFSELIFGSSKVVSEDVLDLFETFKFHLPPECERIFNVMIERNIRVMERNEYTKQLSAELDGAVHPAARDCDVGFDMKKIKHFQGFTLEKMNSFFGWDNLYCRGIILHLFEGREYFKAREKCFNLALAEFKMLRHLFPPERIKRLAGERDIVLYVNIEKILSYELDPDEMKMWIYYKKMNDLLNVETWSQFAHLFIEDLENEAEDYYRPETVDARTRRLLLLQR